VAKGDNVKVGQLVATFTEGASASASAPAKAAASPAAAASAPPSGAPTQIVVPSMGDSISEGSVALLLVAPGTSVSTDQVIAQIETDKVTIDVRAPHAGVLQSFAVAKGDTVKVGQPIAMVLPGAAPAKAAAAAAAPPPPAAKAAAAPPPPPAPKLSKPVAAASSGAKPERRVPMTRLRKRVAERLKGAQNTYAMLSTFNEVDMSAIMALRNDYKDAFLERHGVKLGFMSAFVKASVSALQEVPAVNGVIDGDDVVYRDYYDISVAVGTPKGLVVPVLRGCDAMSFADVEKTIGALGKKARDGTLSMDEMAGGTFTISNGGVYGSLLRCAPARASMRAHRNALPPRQYSLPLLDTMHLLRASPPQHAHHQPAAERHPGHARHRAAPRGDGWRHRGAPHHERRADVRPPADRRP
jgi:2-oxoglutarate dehydrogenase E2 component (dihydrolipoamide succinyltransferase)